ncbi:Ig-like domain repeat protein [Microbacterium sp. KSW2-21]|uniref:Ig-like domain repeat protein n=1 Tax=Microbacterium algihabitans TaxID=3075992 RepID=A0ABU3RZY7_9MICO|nr:Ig-like domain repeat protein [Microbacterium sp. KSW2-21]MDU0328455.1 Ig-like domain repeat protein [Microbacterium sp. KSW2-21]
MGATAVVHDDDNVEVMRSTPVEAWFPDGPAAPNGGPAGTATSAAVFVKSAALVIGVPNKLAGTTSTSFTLAVRVQPLAKNVTAEGTVTVKVDGKTFTGTLSNGKVSIPIGKFSPGTKKITLSYGGSDTVASAKGISVIVVRR